MANRLKWIEFMGVERRFQQREHERDGDDRDFRLGPNAGLKALARAAEYRVAIFAGLCGVCERTLERAMIADYQEAPSAWLRTLQIRHSLPLICKGIKISAVAFEVHFQNATDFSRGFKRHTGYTPSEFYRAWIQNGRQTVGESSDCREMLLLSGNA